MTKENSGDNAPIVVADCVEIFILDGTVHVVYREGAEIGLEIAREMHETFLRITGGKKMPFLYSSGDTLWISKDAREYNRKIESRQPCTAAACVAPTLAIRLMAEFYGKFYKPEIPYKVFAKESDAIEWLNQCSGS